MGTAGALRPVQITLGFDTFPTTNTVSLVSPNQRVSPTYASFSQVYESVNQARMYGGMHFDFSIRTGSDYGMQIARVVADTMFTPL